VNDQALNPHWIAGHLHNISVARSRALTYARNHVTRHTGYVAWSGGKDSTAALHITLHVAPNIPVCWFDSGFEYPETRKYIMDLADQWNVNLHVLTCNPSALDLLETSGAWGATATQTVTRQQFHDTLIAHPAERAHRTHGPGEILGLRAAESTARRRLLATTYGTYQRANGNSVCAPIWDWSDQTLTGYFAQENIPENPVYAKLRQLGAPPAQQRAGLILDGHGIASGRAHYLKMGWPHLWRGLTQRFPLL
jgi:phosphoadenosine phosphosulfate reductase